MSWQYLVFRLPDLTEIHSDIALRDVVLTESLSAPGDFTATLDPMLALGHVRLDLIDVPLIEARGTLIVAYHREAELCYGFIVSEPPELNMEQQVAGITGFGVSSIMDNLPWLSVPWDGVEVDPLDVARLLVAEATSYPNALSVSMNTITSPVRIGEPLQEVEFSTEEGEDVGFEAGPRPRLSNARTPDILKVFQDMTEETPHDWVEKVTLGPVGPPEFFIDLGYPSTTVDKGVDRPRLEFGTDILDFSLETTIAYASEVFVTGGTDKPEIQGHVHSTGRRRLRTVKVIEDKSLTSRRQATNRATAVMQDIDTAYNILRTGGSDASAQYITSIIVQGDTYPVVLGELIEVKGILPWGYHWQSGRVIEITRNVESQTTELTLQPWEVEEV